MPLRTTDYLLGPERVSDAIVDLIMSQIDRPADYDFYFVSRLKYWCRVAGVDFANALSQVLWETANLTSIRHNRDKNPIGFGITSDGTAQPFRINDWDEAARMVVQAIYAMVKKAWHPDVPLPEDGASWMNRVWLAKVRDPNYPAGVDQVRDQNIIYSGNRATWAVDDGYMGHVTRFNSMTRNQVPDQTQEVPRVPQLTPWPDFDDRPLPDKFGAGMTYQYRFPLVGSFDHSMVGWLYSTDGYFRQPGVRAATDWGIGGSGDGAADGKILRWINYHERKYATPWASGWENGPDYDTNGKEYLDTFGMRAINAGAVSVELSGLVATPVSVKQWASLIHLKAAIHHHDLKQGYEEFAWNMHHRDIAEKDCPFPRVYNYTLEYFNGIVLIMKHFETGADVPEFVTIAGKKVPLPVGKGDGVIVPPTNPIYVSFPKPQVVHTVAGARSRQWGNLDAKIIRTYPDDTALRVTGYYIGQEVAGDERWLLIKSRGASNAARIHASVVKEQFNDAGVLKV